MVDLFSHTEQKISYSLGLYVVTNINVFTPKNLEIIEDFIDAMYGISLYLTITKTQYKNTSFGYIIR